MFYFRAGEKGRRPNETSTSKELQRRQRRAILPPSLSQTESFCLFSHEIDAGKRVVGEIESLLSISPPGELSPLRLQGPAGPWLSILE